MKGIDELGISPAPWNQGKPVPYYEQHVVWCGYRDKGGHPSTRIVAECNATFSNEHALFDARLISAAPDLYEALRECLSALNSVGGTGWDGEYASRVKRNAVNALEKAGGGK